MSSAIDRTAATISVKGANAPGNSCDIETPSGKNEKTENFPVGSVLLPKALRPHVAKYYAFARAIDDIADNPNLLPLEKIERLKSFESVLTGMSAGGPGFEKAEALRASMLQTNVTTTHGTDLVAAFVQDAEKNRYQTWEELLGYCALSANPVGRFLLDLHGEDPNAYRYSDALCTVLQVVNHLQDCQEDHAELDRVYLIGEWMDKEGVGVDDITKDALNVGMRQVIDRMLEASERLMLDARKLPRALSSRRLAMESAIIIRLADRLIYLLRNNDPLAMRVSLTKLDFAWAGLRGIFAGLLNAGKGV